LAEAEVCCANIRAFAKVKFASLMKKGNKNNLAPSPDSRGRLG
jgi:hypothetical protein